VGLGQPAAIEAESGRVEEGHLWRGLVELQVEEGEGEDKGGGGRGREGALHIINCILQ